VTAATDNAVRLAEWPYRFDLIELDETYIDKRYQRDLKPILTAYNPALVGVLICSERERGGKTLSVIDGQRRRDLIKTEGLTIGVPALVFFDLTLEEEAELFYLIQKERKGVSQYERHRAEVVAKREVAVALERITKDEGYEIVQWDDKDMRHVTAVRTLERLYNREPELLRQVLHLIALTWDGVYGATREKMLSGVALFIEQTPDVDEHRFVQRLGNVTPSALDVRATQLRDSKELTGASPKFLAEVIQTQYRSRKH
jgi:hypothetical protein